DHRQLRLGAVPAWPQQGRAGRAAARVLAAEGRRNRRPPGRGAVGERRTGRGAQVLRGGAQDRSGEPLAPPRAGEDGRMRAPRLAAAAVCLALAGCVSVPDRDGPAIGDLPATAEAAAMAAQQAREQRVLALPVLAFTGRVALSNGRKGGTGRIEWHQSGDRYEVTLSAPVSRQSWRLTGDAASATIDGIQGGPRSDTDVERLLRDATGLDIPAGALAAWAGGARADEAVFGTARLAFTAAGRLAGSAQDGWTIDDPGWREEHPGDGQPGDDQSPPQLPDRIN